MAEARARSLRKRCGDFCTLLQLASVLHWSLDPRNVDEFEECSLSMNHGKPTRSQHIIAYNQWPPHAKTKGTSVAGVSQLRQNFKFPMALAAGIAAHDAVGWSRRAIVAYQPYLLAADLFKVACKMKIDGEDRFLTEFRLHSIPRLGQRSSIRQSFTTPSDRW